jgi:hypothetical protein
MKDQGDLFDKQASMAKRDAGMALAASNKADLLALARRIYKASAGFRACQGQASCL